MMIDAHNDYKNHNAVFADVAIFFKEDTPTFHTKDNDRKQSI